MSTIITNIDSTTNDGFRTAKVLVRGADDVQEATEAAPFGIDGNPLAEMTAIFAQTDDAADSVIVGYLNNAQLAQPGELRLYSKTDDGKITSFIWLHTDKTLEINADTVKVAGNSAEIMGDADNAVRYKPLDQGLQNFVTFIQAQLALIATGITGVGGVYTPGMASIDISGAKIDEIKTP